MLIICGLLMKFVWLLKLMVLISVCLLVMLWLYRVILWWL